jgi:hypothetical protein
MPGVASAAGSGIWSRRRDEITFDRLQKVPSRALCFVRSQSSIWVVGIGGGGGGGTAPAAPALLLGRSWCPDPPLD